MTPHVHHWDSMMIFEDSTKSLFPSDLFIKPGDNKPVVSDDQSESMFKLYRGAGIFASETPVRQTASKLAKMDPEMVFPMHGSCIERSMFSKYVHALMKNELRILASCSAKSSKQASLLDQYCTHHHWMNSAEIVKRAVGLKSECKLFIRAHHA
jgi:flavorubredoxin